MEGCRLSGPQHHLRCWTAVAVSLPFPSKILSPVFNSILWSAVCLFVHSGRRPCGETVIYPAKACAPCQHAVSCTFPVAVLDGFRKCLMSLFFIFNLLFLLAFNQVTDLPLSHFVFCRYLHPNKCQILCISNVFSHCSVRKHLHSCWRSCGDLNDLKWIWWLQMHLMPTEGVSYVNKLNTAFF